MLQISLNLLTIIFKKYLNNLNIPMVCILNIINIYNIYNTI